MRLILLIVIVSFAGCGDDDKLALGQPCNAHEECASGLCSIPIPDGGMGDLGVTPPKRCMEPGL